MYYLLILTRLQIKNAIYPKTIKQKNKFTQEIYKMKRTIFTIVGLLLVFNLIGCGNSEKQDALLKYINKDLVEISDIETKFLESYESVTGDNYTNDFDMYVEFSNNTSILARELNSAALEVGMAIDDEEILEVHKIYIDSTSNFMNAVSLFLSALETQDYAQLSLANEKLNKANSLALDFKKELNKLAEKYNIVISEE